MRAMLAMGSVRGGSGPPWRTLLLTGLVLALYLFAGPAPEALVYDRTAITGGEPWRLLTGHLVHSDADHALWDILALVLLGTLFEGRLGGWLLLIITAGVVTIDVFLWWGLPEIVRYCGLSGILNGLLAAGLWGLWRESRDPLLFLIAAMTIAKIAAENLSGQALFTDTAWPSVPAVHAVGFATGLLVTGVRPCGAHAPGREGLRGGISASSEIPPGTFWPSEQDGEAGG